MQKLHEMSLYFLKKKNNNKKKKNIKMLSAEFAQMA